MNEEKQEKTQEEVEKIVKCKYNKTFFLFVLGIVFFICIINLVNADANYSTVNGVYTNFNWNETFTNDNFTLSAWINAKSSGTMPILYKPFSYSLLVNPSNNLVFKFNNGTSFVSSGTINLNTWTFVAASYNGTSVNLYINNTDKTFSEYSSGYYKSSNTFEAIIGRDAFNYFNGTIDEVRVFDRYLNEDEVSLHYYSNLKKYDAGKWIFYKIQTGLEIGLNYIYSFFITDFAGNNNSTETRTIKGNTIPTFISVLYSPNSTDDLDPNTNISVVVNISDIDDNFDSAILQWKNSSVGEDWNNITMMNTTLKSIYTLLNASLPLPSYEDNITFKILANDTEGEFNYSDNYTLQSFWDCTWSITPSNIEETIGFFEDKTLGNVTINNTGDSEYSDNNCSIQFNLGYGNLGSSYTSLISDSSNWLTNNRGFQYTTPITLNASTSTTIKINFSFPSTDSAFTETPYVRFTSNINNSITDISYLDTNTNLIISPPQPLLYQKIEDYPSTYVYLTPGAFNLSAYTRNLAGDDTESNTVYNVSFNWTLPSSLSSRLSSGNITLTYSNLTNSTKQYSNLTIDLSKNLALMERGVLNFSIYSYGYDNESNLIVNSNNQTILNDTVSINFLCYGERDGICVSSCGVGVDPDCSPPATSTTTSPGGGGGGGGSSNPLEKVATSADFQLVRGKENEVLIEFQNKDYNKTLKDITFSIKGDIEKYVEIYPKTLSELDPREKINLQLVIISPTYIELGTQELTITMNGKKGVSGYVDSKKITLEIHELSLEEAKRLLNESESFIDKLNEENISSDYLINLFNDSKKELQEFNLEEVRDNYKIISEQAGFALNSKKIIEELEQLIKTAEEKGIEVSHSLRLVKLAKLSLDRREFKQAFERAKEAQLTYALEVKGEFGELSYYLKQYPVRISFGLLFFALFSVGAYNLEKLRRIKKRIKTLKREEEIINQLIKVVQKEAFKEKKMSLEEYEVAMREYGRRMSEIIEELITLEVKRVHLLKFTSHKKKLNVEKKSIIELIKELQRDYLKNKKIETRSYEFKMKSFNKRLSEIEEKLATLEAKSAIKSSGGSFRLFRKNEK